MSDDFVDPGFVEPGFVETIPDPAIVCAVDVVSGWWDVDVTNPYAEASE